MAQRWSFKSDESRRSFHGDTAPRLMCIDGATLVLGPTRMLDHYRFATPAAAEQYRKSVVEVWLRQGFKAEEPETIDGDDVPFDEDEAGPPITDELLPAAGLCRRRLESFAETLAKLRDEGATELLIGEEVSDPPGLFLEAMSHTTLPAVRKARVDDHWVKTPEVGIVSHLFECCPNLVEASIHGTGEIRPTTAAHLEKLHVWDTNFSSGEGDGLAACHLPALRHLSVNGVADGGPQLHDAWVRRLLEVAAPGLEELELRSSTGGFVGLLTANAPSLRSVDIDALDFEDFVALVGEHRIPKSWRRLTVHGGFADLELAREFFTEHAETFANLEAFVLNFEFDDPDEDLEPDEILRQLQALCPTVSAI